MTPINKCLDYVKNAQYSFKEPLAYTALVPVVSTIVKLIKFADCKEKLPTDKFPYSTSRNFEKICKAHCQGSLVQAFALNFFFPGVGSLLVAVAVIDGLHTLYTAAKLHDQTCFPYGGHIDYTKRMAGFLGW